MSTETLKIVYTIQNGHFNGTKKSAPIQVAAAGMPDWEKASLSIMAGGVDIGSFMQFWFYMRNLRGSAAVFEEISRRLRALEPDIPDIVESAGSTGSDIDLGDSIELTPIGTAATGAEIDLVADGTLEAAAATSTVPGVGWALSAGILTIGALITTGLVIYEIVNSGETPLVSVVFINGVPNSSFGFSNPQWDDLTLVGGDTRESMETERAKSTLNDAGALQYTWQTGGSKPNGSATVNFDFDSGVKSTAHLQWSIDPATGTHTCTLTPVTGGNLLTYLCWKKAVMHNEKRHYVLLYMIVPSDAGARVLTYTRDPAKPLIFDNTWARQTGWAEFGNISRKPGGKNVVLQVPFSPLDQSYELRELVLPIAFISGVNKATVTVRVDTNGAPGQVVETIHLQDFGTGPGPVVVQSPLRTLLSDGEDYWITVGMTDPNSVGFWGVSSFLPSPVAPAATSYFRFAVGGDPVN